MPSMAWELLSTDAKAMLIDVRTPAEWAYVGVPDLSTLGKRPLLIPWMLFPTMEINTVFVCDVQKKIPDRETPLLFLCRSGARSRAAATAMTQSGYPVCYNITTGFEGDHDGERHRGTVSGWKVDGLPWIQG